MFLYLEWTDLLSLVFLLLFFTISKTKTDQSKF